MNGSFVLMFESPWQWMVILAIILLLFGSSRLPQLAKSLAQSKKAFKEGLDEGEEDAHREKLRPAANEPRASLSEVDDETLFEEARRRAAQKRAEESNQR
ncbi:MAG TPA: twin-arginine translocase TatA/TatE family subunit [Pyrinomonadaceae bacterium]|jgi:sec-independent protein translocase protein TatA|nr:twin-arginine translocase TatA/TatE family subunit [Pyrinomonadaceae bacterium]